MVVVVSSTSHGCVPTSPALEMKLRTRVGVCAPEGPVTGCAKDLGGLCSSYSPLPSWKSQKCPFSFDGNESEDLNEREVKCRAVTVSVELNAVIVLCKRLA